MITSSFAKEDIEKGEYVTEYQLAMKLGLAAFPTECKERTAILEQAARYCSMARDVGGKFVAQNSWLGAEQVLLVSKLLNSVCRKEWSQIASQSVEVNLWEHRAKECRAKRNYALAKGVNVESVSVEQVSSSPEGLETWASCTVACSIAAGQKEIKSKAKAKPKAPANHGAPSTAALEKQLKASIGSEITTLKVYAELVEEAQNHPDKFSWAKTVLEETAKQKQELDKVSGDDFLQSFKAAALCPLQMKELKKTAGDEYMSHLMNALKDFKPAVEAINKSITKAKDGLI